MQGNNREKHLIIGLVLFFGALIIQLVRLQLVDKSFKISAQNNAFYYQTLYPSRGQILDRNGKVLVGNKNTYDIMVTPHFVKDFDTLELCKIFNLNIEDVRETFKGYKKYRSRIGYRSVTFLKQASQEQYTRFIEVNHKFPKFYGVPRTTRMYPFNAGGNLLGYVTEAGPEFLQKNPEYQQGDYIGSTGLEQSCEKLLRGEKGYNIFLRDARNTIQSSYEDGAYDKPATKGKDVVSTIDAELQSYGEFLMKNKVGSVIAIEPSTGEILSMISSPGIDVSILGEINKHYDSISKSPFKPMFNRSIMSPQPPGSVFKLVNALIGLQENVVSVHTQYPCNSGFSAKGLTLGCHPHKSPIGFKESIMASCNAYYCYLFRNLLGNSKYSSTEEAYNAWYDYVTSFGFGVKLDTDFPSEKSGFVPTAKTYNKIYGKGRWNYLSIISLSIGQGELGCTPLHLANLAATIANRGHYYIPHIIKDHHDSTLNQKYKEKHYTLIDTTHFETVIDGMYMAVNSKPGSGATATIAAVPGLEICGKTGTAENPHGDEHAVFVCFAPRENPQIAIAVYVENAGFGATWAAPVASLMVEKYLNGEIAQNRKYLEDRISQANLLHKVPGSPNYVRPKKNKKK